MMYVVHGWQNGGEMKMLETPAVLGVEIMVRGRITWRAVKYAGGVAWQWVAPPTDPRGSVAST